ncbi:MAG: Wzz/FepE/Etk N-terminal domain-containing protein [Intestinimonas sp.]|jgi:capsular polysaccharide biosynthesis protein|nr:Wzz/FepE/Etk N-terminal domain-containing protein [Intestinimonas sp.]
MNEEIDLKKLLAIIRQKFAMIVLCTCVIGVGTFLVNEFLITPVYSASASMYVYNGKKGAGDTVTTTELNASQQLVQTYIVVLSSDTVLNQVSEQLNGAYTPDEIRKMLTASDISGTEAFQVTITNENPDTAQEIANTIARVAPDEIIRVVKAGAVEVIDYATRPVEPSAPHTIRNTAIGVLLGLVLSTTVFVLLAMLDTAIRSEEDLTNQFNIPILGVIPSLTERESGGGRKA